ncbi:MAG: hypothetical protein WA160_06320 [Pseudobdellovibrio sp.]
MNFMKRPTPWIIFFGLVCFLIYSQKNITAKVKSIYLDELNSPSEKNINLNLQNTFSKQITKTTVSPVKAEERKPATESSSPITMKIISSSKDAEQLIQNLNSNQKSILILDNQQSLARSSSVFKAYAFNQQFQGYDVIDGSIIFFVNPNSGELLRTNTNLKDIDHLPAQDFLEPADVITQLAVQKSLQSSQFKSDKETPSLFSKDGQTHFAYRIFFTSTKDELQNEVLIIDGTTLEILQRYPSAYK